MLNVSDGKIIEQIRDTADLFHDGIVVLRDEGEGIYTTVFVNEYLAAELGYTKDEMKVLIDENQFNPVYISDRTRITRKLNDTREDNEGTETYRLVTKDEKIVWFVAHFFRLKLSGKDCVAIAHTNIHDIIGTQMKLESDNNKWVDIIDSVPIGIAIFCVKNGKNNTIAINKHLVDLANALGTQLDGNHRDWSNEEMVMILNQSIYAFCMDEDQYLVRGMLEESEKHKDSECVFRLRGSSDKNAVYVYCSCTSKMLAEGGTMFYVSFQNVTEEELQKKELAEKQEQLYQLSYFDNLTGVKNRNAFNLFSEECKTNRIYSVGIAFCDLNGLKRTNDTLGHLYGDHMLVEFSSILKRYFSIDEIFRISGDEFVIVRSDVDKYEFVKIMAEVNVAVEKAHNIASIGYMWKDNVSDMRRRITQAEQIMYVEKQRYYEDNRKVSSKHRPILLNKLLQDLDTGCFKMYLQPKAKCDSVAAVGAEALVRKEDINGKVIPPFEFVPQLENEKLIPKIDFFILEEACRFLEQLKKQGKEDFILSVNMSRVTLVENEFFDVVNQIIGRYDFNRNQLEFEITESNETMDSFRLEEYVKEIKELGIGLSLDDVGTEYSSLPMFTLEGIDYVKLDRSLIIQIKSERAKTVVEYMIKMSHALGMKVVAEGVETEEEMNLLTEMGCDMYQGYYLSKPIPVNEFKEKFL